MRSHKFIVCQVHGKKGHQYHEEWELETDGIGNYILLGTKIILKNSKMKTKELEKIIADAIDEGRVLATVENYTEGLYQRLKAVYVERKSKEHPLQNTWITITSTDKLPDDLTYHLVLIELPSPISELPPVKIVRSAMCQIYKDREWYGENGIKLSGVIKWQHYPSPD